MGNVLSYRGLFVVLAALVALASSAAAELLVYEPFDGTVGQRVDTDPNWSEAIDSPLHFVFRNDNLAVPVGVKLKAPEGRRCGLSPDQAEPVTARIGVLQRAFDKVGGADTGTHVLYVSYLTTHDLSENHPRNEWAGTVLGDSEGGARRQLYAGKFNPDDDQFVLETVPYGGNMRVDGVLRDRTVRFVVLKIEWNRDPDDDVPDFARATVWFDPDCTAGESGNDAAAVNPPTKRPLDLLAGDKAWAGSAFDVIRLDAGSSNNEVEHNLEHVAFDELRIGTAWADVTPVDAAHTVATPTIDPNGGPFVDSRQVTLTTTTPGAAIRYTLDGSEPSTASTLYTEPIVLTASATVTARAFKQGMAPSATASAQFTLSETLTTPPVTHVRLGGRLGNRLTKTVPYLIAQHDMTHPNDRANFNMLDPFINRGAPNERDWDGEYAGKWLDAASLLAANTNHAGLKSRMNVFAEVFRRNQAPSGYMGIRETPGGNWDMWNMWYALYGFMSHYEFQGNDESLAAAERTGRYIVDAYLPPDNDFNILSGAWSGGCTVDVLDQLMRLHRLTGDADLKAGLMGLGDRISNDYGPIGNMRDSGTVHLSHAYVVSAYLGGMAMYNRQRGDTDDLGWIEDVWQDVATGHLFHTYSIGQGERLREPADYLLGANKQETCATVEWLLFTERMYLATGDAKYVEQIENTVYNALLGAQSTDGMNWMYHTRMNADEKDWFAHQVRCCYWSGPRGIARLPRYVFRTDREGLRVDFYEPASATGLEVGGTTVDVTLEGDYPASGLVTIVLTPAEPADFVLKLRLPQWAEDIDLEVNGQPADVPLTPGQYAMIDRTWQAGDTVSLALGMTAFVVTRPSMTGIEGGAVQRGPEVLALDERDNPGLDLSLVTLYSDPQPMPAGTAGDRRLYSCKALVNGSPDTVVMTPFADAGNDGAAYRTVLSVSDRTTPQTVLGDFNNDGGLNALDIPGFIQALGLGRDAYLDRTGVDADVIGDFNGDGTFNGLDIPGFKQALTGG